MAKRESLKHIAFIMDGNGRWATARGLPRFLGHKAGCDRVIDIYEECRSQGVKVMSLYAFSTENWNRPKSEINHLFKYLEIFFKKEIDRMIKEGCHMIASGDLTRLPKRTQKVVQDAMEKPKTATILHLIYASTMAGKPNSFAQPNYSLRMLLITKQKLRI